MKKKTYWIWILIGVAVVAVAARLAVYLLADDWTGSPWYGYMGMGGWMMPLGMVGMAAFWVIVVIVVSRSFADGRCGRRDLAATRLKERLANGDITIEEYETLRKKIGEEC